MKCFVIACWKGLGFILIVAGLLWGIIDSCSKKTDNPEVKAAVYFDLRASIADSVLTVAKRAENVKIDSMSAIEGVKTQSAMMNAAYWESIARNRAVSAAKFKNKADSLAAAYSGTECKELINAFRQVNDTLSSVNAALKSEITALSGEAEGSSRQLYLCDKQGINKDLIIASKDSLIEIKNITISAYQNQLNKKEPFFKKYEKWIFGVVGIVATALILK